MWRSSFSLLIPRQFSSTTWVWAGIWTIDSGISYADSIDSLTQAAVQTMSQTWLSLDGWQSQLSLFEDRSRHSKSMNNISPIYSGIHICDRELPQSFQVPRSIDNTMHTLVLRSHAWHTECISKSAILSNNFLCCLVMIKCKGMHTKLWKCDGIVHCSV